MPDIGKTAKWLWKNLSTFYKRVKADEMYDSWWMSTSRAIEGTRSKSKLFSQDKKESNTDSTSIGNGAGVGAAIAGVQVAVCGCGSMMSKLEPT